MLESERHRLILSVLREKPVATVKELVTLTGASEATIRRDIATLHHNKKVRRMRGGVEAMIMPPFVGLAGRPFFLNKNLNVDKKRAIARKAVEMCEDGEAIIVNGGTTTFQMVHYLTTRRLQVFTNSFPIAEHLLAHSGNTVIVPGGTLFREQNIILSPFSDDGSRHFAARRMFMGAHSIGPLGVMEADPLIVQAEEKLINQAEELIILADSSKFTHRSSLLLCALERVTGIITDNGISNEARAMIEESGVDLEIVPIEKDERPARN